VCVCVCVHNHYEATVNNTSASLLQGIFTDINSNEHNFKIKAMIFLGNVVM
jgi:hypothetical protein